MYGGKFSDMPSFSICGVQNSHITFQGYHLFYDKFSHQTFATMAHQYLKMTDQPLIININGLILEESLQIQKIIQTPLEEKTFEYLLNHFEEQELMVPQQYRQPFNQIIFRIIKQKQYHEQPFNGKVVGKKEEIQADKVEVQIKAMEVKNLIYWVDDEPSNNTSVIENYLKPKGIDVIQITSTKEMVGILEKEGTGFNNSKTLFISDMTRMEGNVKNCTAGIDLFEYLYHTLQVTSNAIAFVNNIQGTAANIQKRKLKQDRIIIINRQKQLVNRVWSYFGIENNSK